MNNILNKVNLYLKIKNTFKKNSQLIYILIAIIIFILFSFQLYSYFNNKKILKASIEYNIAKSTNSSDEFKAAIKELSYENNFFGLLASLESIKISLSDGDFNSAKNEYLILLNRSDLDNLYKTAIAIHASYKFINLINKNNFTEMFDIINQFQTFVDPNLESYDGFKLEILYMLSIMKSNNLNNSSVSEETKKLYIQIQENDKITSSVKERVNKIHEFQIYK